ncbi:conserved hypothetical protein [Thermosulfidibacter takaii ABI70S6]|uniref:Cytochrome b561 bacterial/Ni-hydrogenase domain-containing protein n=1 Tax=Thermosulfidibacter takaii (strain DSM 17441 / JCM 13301 / NBRC 103674 / ABI70S6) TaxID=1298851 RepID=A0A0S3QS37_THET7|nr:cytochrome b/b6 domain-containing protein [Thermosulfidibacter takaii]BAT71150.1 conserved hypothetical protein [Thermosulfidibacter takaii ABI70S6]
MDKPKDPLFVERFTLNERIQHFILFVAVLLLLISGFALKYYYTPFGRAVISLGGFEMRGTLHRIGAVLLTLVTFYHLCYILFTKRGHELFLDLLPKKKDLQDFKLSLLYKLRATQEKPKFDRFNYRQKLQYWLVAGGVISMEITGYMLWFHNKSIAVLSKKVLDIVYVFHSYEAMLVFVVIVLWHLYDMHLRDHFPMDPVWLTGKISVERLKKEHPLEYERLFGKEDKE